MKRANRIMTVLIFIFLYIPMAVLVVASFNTGKDITQFQGFTLSQYQRLFQDRSLLKLLGNSLFVSILASLIATVFGTVSAVGIHNLNPKMRKVAMTFFCRGEVITRIPARTVWIFHLQDISVPEMIFCQAPCGRQKRN